MINQQPNTSISQNLKKAHSTKVLSLQGLSCANCAGKIEKAVQSLPGISYGRLDFTTSKLFIELDKGINFPKIAGDIRRIVEAIEPHVRVIDPNEIKQLSKDHFHGEEGGHEHNHAQSRRPIGLLLAAVSIFLATLALPFPFPLKLGLYLVTYGLVGGEILKRAWQNMLQGHIFDENFLMSVATLGAFAIGEYPEAVAVMLFYQIGEYFQGLAVDRSRRSIASLMDIRPDYAHRLQDGELLTVSPEAIRVGDIIVVKPGERVPLDGRIIQGESSMDTSSLTGESAPRQVGTGNEILSGFINNEGLLQLEVTKEFGESTVAKILNLVENAASKKAPTENFITKFARYYTPVVVFSALVIAFLPPLIIAEAALGTWIYRALVFLIISCPCALVVSIPLSFFGGIGAASRHGILVKGSNYLEALNEVDTVVFDKTGTLTKGVFKVVEIHPEANIDEKDLLEYAAHAESFSNHPIATSIREAYGQLISTEFVKDFQEIAGLGLQAKVHGKQVLVGNSRLMENHKITPARVETLGTSVHLAVEGTYWGYLIISDEIKEDAAQAIRDLKLWGIRKTVMLTGDNHEVGQNVGKTLGIDEVYAQLLPQDKVTTLEKLTGQSRGKVIFVGDGINDAPVLARADIGVAMGGLGSDAAIEAADVVLMTDEPAKLGTALKVAKHTRRIVTQNIILALGVKGLFLLLGALGIATLWEAVFADVGVTVLAVLNALRVLKVVK